MSEVKTREKSSPIPRPASEGDKTTSTDSEHKVIKQCHAADLPEFVRYGCLGCLNIHAGDCLFGNEVGDQYCLRDRKLNTRATAECLQKGCLSAMHVENRTLVCAHIADRCECIDSLGNTYGNIQKTRSIAEIIDEDRVQETNRIASLLKYQPRRHPSGAIITEDPAS